MNKIRLHAILNTYGADSNQWPEAERAEAIAFLQASSITEGDSHELENSHELKNSRELENSHELNELLKQAKQLDAHLNQNPVPEMDLANLQNRILSHIPAQSNGIAAIENTNQDLLDRLLDWFFPNQTGKFWQPTFAAALTLTIGILIGSGLPNTESIDEDLYYEDEIYLLGLSAEAVEINYE